MDKKVAKALRIATFNCKGANRMSAREKIVHIMRTHKLAVPFLQETHINTNTEETHDQYHFCFSTCVTDKAKGGSE